MSTKLIELLTEIRDNLADLNTLAVQREKARVRMAAKRSAAADVREQTDVREQKETESGKEEIPPLESPKGEKGKEKEMRHTLNTRARACEELSDEEILALLEEIEREMGVSLKRAQSFAKLLISGSTPEIVDEWYDACRAAFWEDRDGQRIRNWCDHLAKWIKNDPMIKKARDPDRIYDCRKPPTAAEVARQVSVDQTAAELAKELPI